MSKISNVNYTKLKKRVAALALCATIIGTTALGFSWCASQNTYDDNLKIIEEYCGEDSYEVRFFKYLDILQKFPNVVLEQYDELTDNVREKLDLNATLKTPEELEMLINKYLSMDSNSKDIGVQSERLYLIAELKSQKALLDKYVLSDSKDQLYDIVLTSVKKYAAELYGVEDYNDIKVFESKNNSSGEISYKIVYISGGVEKDEEIITDENLKEGVKILARFKRIISNGDVYRDKEKYADILAESAHILFMVNQLDLYDSDAANKLNSGVRY